MASGELAPALAGALLVALRTKGETAEEIRGFARGMRELAKRPAIAPGPYVDIVGTGGDGSGSLNLSTGSALLAAACGAPIVKHGNRSVSSRSGSADVLAALGLPIPLDETQAGACLQRFGFTFLFAPHYHPAMKHIAPVRQALGVRTVFNILGPLVNPAAPPYHVIGAFSDAVAKLMAETLSGMKIGRVFVIHGASGWDEATPAGPFICYDVRPGKIERELRDSRDYGMETCSLDELRGGDAAFNAARVKAALAGGDTGRAIVVGKSDSSELYRRVTLPPDDDEHMPAEGKTPLTDEQIQIVHWWIDAGAPHGKTVGEIGVDAATQSLIAAEVGLAGASPASVAVAPAVAANSAIVDTLYHSGFLVRQVSQTDARLIVSVYSPGARVIDEHMAVLLSAADQIVELNLQDAGLDDEVLANVGRFTELTRLRLSRNEITDRTVAEFKSMPHLERLNLYANPGVTDASVEVLAGLGSLRRVDLWQTGISDAGVARLRGLRPDLELQTETTGAITGIELQNPAGAR